MWEYEHDSKGNTIKETDPNGRMRTYEYDSKGNRIKETFPYGYMREWEFVYNSKGMIENIRKIKSELKGVIIEKIHTKA